MPQKLVCELLELWFYPESRSKNGVTVINGDETHDPSPPTTRHIYRNQISKHKTNKVDEKMSRVGYRECPGRGGRDRGREEQWLTRW